VEWRPQWHKDEGGIGAVVVDIADSIVYSDGQENEGSAGVLWLWRKPVQSKTIALSVSRSCHRGQPVGSCRYLVVSPPARGAQSLLRAWLCWEGRP
jgi:hypothetical protein